MRACTFVCELWRKKQSNLNLMRMIQSSSILKCNGDYRQLHSGVRFIQSPLAHKADQEVRSLASVFLNSSLEPSVFQRCRFFSFASSQGNENETVQSENKQGSTVETSNADQTGSPDNKADSDATDMSQSVGRRRRRTIRTKFSDSESDSESDLSKEDLVKLLAEKEELLKEKQKEMENFKEGALRSLKEKDNIIGRTKREAENSKNYAIQKFAKSLLDVADNLNRASSVVKDRFTKIDATEDTAGALPLLETLLEGVEMTEKQLAEVFKKFGVEKYDPINEQFDPNRHNAVFPVTDPSKPPDTVAVVLKPGYMLHDRILRPAEVGVTVCEDSNEAKDQ